MSSPELDGLRLAVADSYAWRNKKSGAAIPVDTYRQLGDTERDDYTWSANRLLVARLAQTEQARTDSYRRPAPEDAA
jgi:DMSO/TMAO reductase YedYZ molybdopterin-dependent catalytic subunit